MKNKDGWTEVESEEYEMPEGYLGNLTPEHEEKLHKMWDTFFDVCERATGSKVEGKKGFAEDWGVDTEAAKKKTSGMGQLKGLKNTGISKEDDAKDKAQARAEEANMENLLSTYGPESLRNAFWALCKRDHPDIAMLRFLRARKWDISRTIAMIASTLKWRLDTNLDTLLENGDLGNGKQIPKYIENFDENGKVFTLGTNHKNQPVMYVQFKKHVIWAQPQATTKKFIIAHFELVRLLVVPPNDKIVLLFDCTGFGPSNLDVTNFLYILQCLQSYFPETLAVLYLHKAPWILQQAWHMVKWLLDPVVRAKVQFTNHPEELMKEIPSDNLLKYIGGNVDCIFDWVPPEEGENHLQEDLEERERRWQNHRRLCTQFEQVTRAWIDAGGQEGEEERRILAKKLRLSHFDYEPYWRGLWVHHRNGDLPLGNPGVIRWQYPRLDSTRIRQVLGQEQSRKSILRELQEIAVGAPVDVAEAHTKEMLKDGSWGRWDTCDDMGPPPTGYRKGKFVYDDDGGVAARIDVIGLDGPETLKGAQQMGGTNGSAKPKKKAKKPKAADATNGSVKPMKKKTKKPKAADSAAKQQRGSDAPPKKSRKAQRNGDPPASKGPASDNSEKQSPPEEKKGLLSRVKNAFAVL